MRLPGSIRILCEAAPNYAIQATQCLEDTGLKPFDLYNTETRVTLAQEITAIRNFLSLAPDRLGLGIEIGRHYRPEIFGIWGYAIISSPTLRAGLKTAFDFAKLGFIIATMELDETCDPPLVTFDTSSLQADIKSFVLERHLTVLTNFSKALLPDLPLSEYVFHTTITDPQFAVTIASMLGAKVELGCARDAIALSSRLLDKPLPQHDPMAMEHCLEQCRHQLSQLDEGLAEWTEKVRDATIVEVCNDPTVGLIASKLSVSERTLRRRLSEEGTTFRQVLIDARLAIGYELLNTASLDVSTVAWRTGYSEPSSFVRAFVKKYGFSPGKLKRKSATRNS